MPRYNDHNDDKLLEIMDSQNEDKFLDKNKESNAGLIVSAGDVQQSDYDDMDWETLLLDYTKMRDGDCIASKTIEVLKLPMLQSEFIIEPGNETEKAKEAAEFIEWQLNNLYKGFGYFKKHMLLSLDFGLSMFEKVYKRGVKYNGKNTNIIWYLSPIQLDTILEFYYSDGLSFTGVRHEKRVPNSGSSFIDIDKDKLFWYTFNEEFENIKGRSLLRPARQMWQYKHALWTAGVRGSQKGSGIVRGRVGAGVSPSQKATFEKLLRTTAAAKQGYILDYKDVFEVELLELKNQQNIMPMIEQADREMFFNTLSEFLISGIGNGANGSRAATSEHKTAYELYANSILQSMEDAMNVLICEMIRISHLGGIAESDYPTFKFMAINQIDKEKVARNAALLYEKSIVTRQEGDEGHFREIFGYPEVKELKDQVVIEEQEMSIKLEKRHQNHFDLERANNQFLKGQNEAEIIIDNVLMQILEDASKQAERNYNQAADSLSIRVRFKEILIDRLETLYNSLADDGRDAVMTELKKLGIGQVKLSITPNRERRKSRTIGKFVDRFLTNVKVSIEALLTRSNDVLVEKAGGIRKFIFGKFGDAFKGDKRNLTVQVQSGYTSGRAEANQEFQSEIELYQYDSNLDNRLCEECATHDGEILTRQEIDGLGLNFTYGQVNPSCLGNLGQNDCRCQLVPYKLKGD